MYIFSKGAVAKQDSRKEIAHLSARKELYSEYKRRERILSGERAKAGGGGDYRALDQVQDVPMLRKVMKQHKKDYERGAPETLTPATRNQMWLRAKQLKDQFTVGMLKKSELHPVSQRLITKGGQAVTGVVADYDKIRSQKVLEREQAWQKKNKASVKEFKNIMRQLEPDNPNLPNVERFRKT